MSRRWALTIVASGVLAFFLAVAAGWFFWLPAYRPALRPGESYGIDVSSYQHAIDWQQVARQHISFAYIKATEGATLTDPMFAANWLAASKAGIPHGAYHFYSLCSTGIAQARLFLRALPAASGGLAPALDLELSGNCSKRPPARAVAAQLNAFLRLVQAITRQTVVIYLGSDFAHRYPLALYSRHPLWLRRILLRPPGHWTVWQVNSKAHIGGVNGDVDLDIGRSHLTGRRSQTERQHRAPHISIKGAVSGTSSRRTMGSLQAPIWHLDMGNPLPSSVTQSPAVWQPGWVRRSGGRRGRD